jgi:ribosomal protein L2
MTLTVLIYCSGKIFRRGETLYSGNSQLKPGMRIISGENVEIAEGNCMPLKNIPLEHRFIISN